MSDPERVDPRVYSAFVRQIEIANIWLLQCEVDNAADPGRDQASEIHVYDRAEWEDQDGGFLVKHYYRFEFREDEGPDEQVQAKIYVSFALGYASEEKMTDLMFDLFAKNNLRLNSWPYAREFVSSTLGRMGWLPVTLPAFKTGGPEIDTPKPPEPKPKAKPRSRKRATGTDEG